MKANSSVAPYLSWVGIARLGLVQAALGSIVVLMTSTINRVMVVELSLPAMLPAALVGWHYAIQILRPRFGFGSDMGGRRTPWIMGGMAVLALGGVGAAGATMLLASSLWIGLVAGVIAYLLIGVGVGAAGTSLLALLAARVAPDRKAAAAAIVWIMMIVGFVVTAILAGALLDPFSLSRLVLVATAIGAAAIAIACLAVRGLEPGRTVGDVPPAPAQILAGPAPRRDFQGVLAEVWTEGPVRRFTLFVFVSMLAYSAPDLILEPFAGIVYGLTAGQSTSLSGAQNGGVLLGMIVTAIVATRVGRSRPAFLRAWAACGCLASALALLAIAGAAAAASQGEPLWPLPPLLFALGVSNGAFAVAAIGSMMALASAGREGREGTRMGLWGAAQAIAFGLGGFLGAAALDGARAAFGAPAQAFGAVFAIEAAVFVLAAWLALRVGKTSADAARLPAMPAGGLLTDHPAAAE